MSSTNLKQKSPTTCRINIPTSFIDYCNIRGIDLHAWYQWRLHIQREQKKTWVALNGYSKASK